LFQKSVKLSQLGVEIERILACFTCRRAWWGGCGRFFRDAYFLSYVTSQFSRRR
jgi:hypothetical protein